MASPGVTPLNIPNGKTQKRIYLSFIHLFPVQNHIMSPVNGLDGLAFFTALSLEKSLFIFGMLGLLKCKLIFISGGRALGIIRVFRVLRILKLS